MEKTMGSLKAEVNQNSQSFCAEHVFGEESIQYESDKFRDKTILASAAPKKDEQEESLAELVLFGCDCRCRLESSGEPFEVRPRKVIHDQDRPLSVADVLRSGRRRVAAPNEGLLG
jgi:hypothetical protein